jgi:hypothetical protein
MIDNILEPVDVVMLRDADYLSFAFNITELIGMIESRNYSISKELIYQSFESSVFNMNYSIPTNYSCHIDVNCEDREYII